MREAPEAPAGHFSRRHRRSGRNRLWASTSKRALMARLIRHEDDESPRRELERDPNVGIAPDATNQRVEEVRESLARDPSGVSGYAPSAWNEPPPGRPASDPGMGEEESAPLPADVPPTLRTGEVHARPPSLQADEGQRDALRSERAPYDLVPESDTLGARHIHEALDDLPFPMSRDELLARAGAWRIPVTGRAFRTLAEYLAPVERSEFADAHDVAHAVDRAWRR